MTTRKEKKKGNHSSFLDWNHLNHTFNNLEKQVSTAYDHLKHMLPKSWAKNMKQWSPQDFLHLAQKRKNWITKEVKYYTNGLLKTVKKADILPDKNRLLKEAKTNLNAFLKKLQKSNVAHRAKDLAKANSTKLLSLLDFPTKKDVTHLNRRLSELEKRIRDLKITPVQ